MHYVNELQTKQQGIIVRARNYLYLPVEVESKHRVK